ncbi:helix-turn-helix domain-containing protein [Shewanella psychrotolerans]|uniref:helix-turn-helix domain-containing protein n=1 Tax=Shewanella psychrotolerans TaxID=2864206 RepID=UPI001C6586B7|nr:helix-turn-helix domain-containing protein [Shewanella psychrotolerans]QYK00807.1 helix-turn-helix domain-containing protein [Shewanella psychrotolerans]
MQIGSCWFDMSQAQLSNQENETSWMMPKAEFAVLKQLAKHRGQVLSNSQLLACLDENERNIERLKEALERIKFFLGEPSAILIEAVDDQGFILHDKLKQSSGFSVGLPGKSISRQKYILLISQLILLLLLLYSVFEPYHDTSMFYEVVTPSLNETSEYTPTVNTAE